MILRLACYHRYFIELMRIIALVASMSIKYSDDAIRQVQLLVNSRLDVPLNVLKCPQVNRVMIRS